ncbi:MAG: DEAD/DEAH box helicase, partial [Dehalococcoidia bacterium]
MEAVQVLPAAEILPALTDAEQVDALVRGLDFSNCKTSERDRVNDDLAELMSGLSMDNASLYAGFLLRHTLLDHLAAMGNAEGGHPSSGLRAGSGPPLRGAGVGADGGALVRTEVRAHSRAPLRGADAGAPVLIVDEPAEVEEAGRHLEETAEKLRLAKEERGELPRHFPAGMLPWREAEAVLRGYAARLALTRFHHVGDDAVTLSFGSPPSYHSALDKLTDSLKGGRSAPVVIATQHSRRMEEVLREADVGVRETRSLEALDTDVVDVVHTSLPGGWVLRAGEDDDRPLVTLLTDNEVFGTAKRRVTRPRRHAQRLRAVSADELQPGQYVVHVDHGIGKFVETISRSAGGTEGDTDAREYLVLEYAEGDRLYVPMEHLDRISPYIGGDEAAPSPTRLGTQEWTRAVSRAKESTKKLAVDLLALYAQREMAEGFPHGSDTPWQREVEDAFPFVETPDQQSAIDEVKNDMEQAKPMDRLVCGDVGYGKTEVALRAAVKAVMSGRQVALLVPTTVLAQQHYMNFAERLSPFPVTVEVLSRFRSHKEQDEIIAKLKSGDIDIVIGTHRLVQKDVGFKELGLVIIDEEHRFGVGHKERLKELRQEVDVLTLTATPIPRT